MLRNFADMLLVSIFQTVEFYVIAVVVASAIVAFFGRRPADGPVREHLLPGVISREEATAGEPTIELLCADDGSVLLRRHGLKGVFADGAVSIAVEVKGFDVAIRERIVAGRNQEEPVNTASFILDFMGQEHYFISYRSELTASESALFAAVTINNRSGFHISKTLQ